MLLIAADPVLSGGDVALPVRQHRTCACAGVVS